MGYLRGGGRGIMGGIVCNKGGKREGRVGKQLKVVPTTTIRKSNLRTACAVSCFVDN